jgi:hypothetical protein
MTSNIILGPPASSPAVLEHRPQVLSWDAPQTWAQQRLIPYRAEIAKLFAHLDGDPLSFRLDCGLGPTSDVEAAGDIDNLLVPVVDALGPHRFVAAWGTKNAGMESRLAVGSPTQIAPSHFDGWGHAAVRTTTSSSTSAWKAEIASQVAAGTPLPATGAAALVIAFAIGPGRAWHNLWKPAIDSLGQVLGPGPRQWHPRDGRITELGLCVRTEPRLGWAIAMDIWWQPRPW